MTYAVYELHHDSLLRDRCVYYPGGFAMFAYYLFYISVENSSIDTELDSNQN